MARPIFFATALLVVGLVIGGAAAFAFVTPPTSTQTQSVTITDIKTVLLTQTTTLTQQVTTTSTVSTTVLALTTSTSLITSTVTVASAQFTNQTRTVTPTVTQTTTSATTITMTSTQTITSIATGRTLVTYSGAGNADSPPFAPSVADVQVNFNATATGGVSGVALAWQIHAQGNTSPTCNGSINAQQGSFVGYCYGLVPGTEYYIQISSANANWSVDVVELG